MNFNVIEEGRGQILEECQNECLAGQGNEQCVRMRCFLFEMYDLKRDANGKCQYVYVY